MRDIAAAGAGWGVVVVVNRVGYGTFKYIYIYIRVGTSVCKHIYIYRGGQEERRGVELVGAERGRKVAVGEYESAAFFVSFSFVYCWD